MQISIALILRNIHTYIFKIPSFKLLSETEIIPVSVIGHITWWGMFSVIALNNTNRRTNHSGLIFTSKNVTPKSNICINLIRCIVLKKKKKENWDVYAQLLKTLAMSKLSSGFIKIGKIYIFFQKFKHLEHSKGLVSYVLSEFLPTRMSSSAVYSDWRCFISLAILLLLLLR